jgi:hypothetical protein
MISRDVGQLQVVHAHDATQFDADAGSFNQAATSTADHIAGRIVDRLSLGAGFNSVMIHYAAYGEPGTSTADDHLPTYAGIGAWLYHSPTTCADDFSRYSTQNEKAVQALFVGGTSTGDGVGFMSTSTSEPTWTATATGKMIGDYWAGYSLTGAGRYVQPYLVGQIYSCEATGPYFTAYGDLIFGEPDTAPPSSTSTMEITTRE